MAFTEQEEEILRSLIQQSDPLLNLASSEKNIMESLGAEKTSLSELPAGIDVLDEDLFLFRSGQVDQSLTFSQLRALVLSNVNLMVGASETTSGKSGLVTTPPSGSQNKVLYGDGNWKPAFFAGMIMPYGGANSPDGWTICDGKALSRETYWELFNVIGTYFGYGDGSTTFNVPNLRGRALKGASNSKPLGTTIQAGVPNLAGEFGGGYHARSGHGEFGTGPFYVSRYFNSGAGDHSDAGVVFGFDASRANSVYGRTVDTVEIDASSVNFIIKL